MLPLEQDPHAIDPKEIASLERARPIGHLRHRHSARVSGSDEGSDAGAGNDRRLDSELLEGAKDANVREPLEPASAQHQRDLERFASGFGGSWSFEAAGGLTGHA
jgi:hypothetical protein